MKYTDILFEETMLVEGLMSDAEWSKEKYWTAFVDNLRSGQTLFNFKTKEPDLVPGFIQNPKQLADEVEKLYSSKFSEKTRKELLRKLPTFKVIEADEDENPIPGKEFPGRLTQIFKDEQVTGALQPNMGDVAEAILGCAVTAKFEKRGAEITVNDAIDVGRRIADANGEIIGQAGKDQLHFKVSIPFISKKAFYSYIGKDPKTLKDYNVPQKTIDKFASYFTNAVEYANKSKRVAGAIQKAQSDSRKNKVDVISDGGEKANQSITKVDLKVLFDGTSINLLSLKAGTVTQFGQVSGVNFDNLAEFFATTVGLKLSDAVRKKFIDIAKGARGKETLQQKMKNYTIGVKSAYNEIFKQLKVLSKSDPAVLIKRVYAGTLFHLTRGEKDVEMVILEPSSTKAFSELSFGPEFRKSLNQLQLFVEEAHTPTDYYLHVYGIPKTELARKVFKSKERLITLRSRIDGKSFRNVIGMGPLLKSLADIEQIIQKPTAPVKLAPAAKKPVTATPPVRVAKQPPVPATNPEIDEPIAQPRARRTTAQPVRPRR